MNDDFFQQHRTRLLNLAYRMVGSVAEAEDIVQDAWMRRLQHGEEVRDPAAWLTRTTTRLCLDHLRSARYRREQYVGPWLPEPVRTDGDDPVGAGLELADALSVAMLVLLERLSPTERAAFLLREVFDYDYEDIADMLTQSQAGCRQLVSRAKGHLRKARARFDVDPGRRADLIRQFARAVQSGDMDGLLALMKQDCVFYSDGGGKAIAALRPVYGADRVARFLLGVAAKSPGMGMTHVHLNGEPALLFTMDNQPVTAITMALDAQGAITQIFATRNPDKMTHLG